MTADNKKTGKAGIFTRIKRYVTTENARQLMIMSCAVLCVLILFLINVTPVRYDLKAGETPHVTIKASKEIVDEVETQRAREQAANTVAPIYIQQEGVTDTVLDDMDHIFESLDLLQQYADTLENNSATRIYTQEETDFARTLVPELTLSTLQVATVMRSSPEDLDRLYQKLRSNTFRVMSFYKVSAANLADQISYILELTNDVNNLLLVRIGKPVLEKCVQPNVVIDEDAFAAAKQSAAEQVAPIVYHQGQNIIVNGESQITDSQIAVLRSLGLLRESRADLKLYLGSSLLVILVMVCACMLLIHSRWERPLNTTQVLLSAIIFVISFGLCLLARLVNAYLAPILLCVLLMTTMVSMSGGIILNAALCIIVASLAAGSSEEYTLEMVLILVCSLLTGSLAALMMRGNTSRKRVLVVTPVIVLINTVLCFAYSMLTTNDLSSGLNTALWMAGGTAVSLLLYFALQLLLELIFNLPTPLKLMELSNPAHPLLRRLMMEAPGTYNHSVIVANLAEASAEAIGCDPLLVRVGAYYHDIGKLMRPSWFSENQMGEENAHDHTDPQVSAAILTAHPRDGVTLAREYRLPQAVQQIIATHHGDAPVMYFYHKAVQQANGKSVNIDDFRYDSTPPATKEAAIIMLCDTIEAAVRSMKEHDPDAVESFIIKLIRGKLEDGQLSNSPLTLQDIDKICHACIRVLGGVYHERVQYPSMPQVKRPLRHEKESPDTRQEPEPAAPAADSIPPSEPADEKTADQDAPAPAPAGQTPAEPADPPEPLNAVSPAADAARPADRSEPETASEPSASPVTAETPAAQPNPIPEAPQPEGPGIPILVVEPDKGINLTKVEVPMPAEKPVVLNDLLQSMSSSIRTETESRETEGTEAIE